MERGNFLSTMTKFVIFDNILVMSTSSFTMQIFNDDNSLYCHGTCHVPHTMPIFFDNYFVMSTSSFTMQTFNHDNSNNCHGTWQVPQ